LVGIGVRIVAIVVLVVVLFKVIIREHFVGLLHFGELVFAVGVDVGVEGFDELEV
jgi:general stress protein CsbA